MTQNCLDLCDTRSFVLCRLKQVLTMLWQCYSFSDIPVVKMRYIVIHCKKMLHSFNNFYNCEKKNWLDSFLKIWPGWNCCTKIIYQFYIVIKIWIMGIIPIKSFQFNKKISRSMILIFICLFKINVQIMSIWIDSQIWYSIFILNHIQPVSNFPYSEQFLNRH